VIALPLAAYGVIQGVARRVIAGMYRQPLTPSRQWRAGLFLLMVILLSLTGLPSSANLWLHRPLLDRYVQLAYYTEPALNPSPRPRFIGLLHVRQVRISPTEVEIDLGWGRSYTYRDDRSPRWCKEDPRGG
jgi:hypothetical protein